MHGQQNKNNIISPQHLRRTQPVNHLRQDIYSSKMKTQEFSSYLTDDWRIGTWFLRGAQFATPTAETPHPPPHCANIHCLVSVNSQQLSMNIIGCNYFGMQEFNYTPLFHKHFHVRNHFVRLPLCCHLSHGNKI